MSDLPPAGPADRAASGIGYRIIRATFVVLFFWVFWKFGGYIVTAMVVRRFGSGAVSDAYFFATQAVVYGLIFAPALAVLVPAFIPVFIQERNERGERAASQFAGTVLMLLLLGCVLMLAAAYAFARPVTETLVRGFDGEARALGVRLLHWLLPGVALMVVFLLLRAILNSYKVFSYPSAAEALQKLLWVAFFVATVRLLGIQAVVLGFLVGSVAMVGLSALGLRHRPACLRPGLAAMSRARFVKEALVALAFLLATGVALYGVANYMPGGLARYRDLVLMTVVLAAVLFYALQLWQRSRGRPGAMARFAVLAVPLLISTFFAAYRNVVTFYFQSFTARGVFSDLEGARKIANFPIELVALALSVAMLPYLCELASKKDHALLGDIVTKALRMLAVGFVPLTVMTLILAEPVCRLVLDRGDRSLIHIEYTVRALRFFAFALLVYAAERVIMQAYFSLQRMWTPALLGIAATFFQVAFLAVPIYWLGWDYPVHVFVLVALAYPVSRIAKILLLVLILRRHLPVLPAGPSAAFALKLVVLSVAVGVAGHFVLRWTERAVPYEQYRQHKVVVDSFDVQPHTWSSLNADEVRIQPAPGDSRQGAAVAMDYRRHGRVTPELTRRFDGLRTGEARRLSFAEYTDRDMGTLFVMVKYRDGRAEGLGIEGTKTARGRRWRTHSMDLAGGEIDRVSWSEISPAAAGSNTLFVDDVRLTDAEGRVLFAEDFDHNGWEGAAGTRWLEATSGQRHSAGYGLRLPDGAAPARKELAAYESAGTDTLRCRLLNDSAEGARVRLVLTSPRGPASRSVALEPGKWQTTELSRRDLGWDEETWQAISAVEVRADGEHGDLYLDDLTFRRPPQVMRYALAMLVHCTLPSLAGLAVMLACLVLLRIEELGHVVQWVKARGWRRDAVGGGGAADGEA